MRLGKFSPPFFILLATILMSVQSLYSKDFQDFSEENNKEFREASEKLLEEVLGEVEGSFFSLSQRIKEASPSEDIRDESSLGSELSLLMLTFYSMAAIGEYEIERDEIPLFVDVFERLTGRDISLRVQSLLDQIKKIKFGKKNAHHYIQIFALNKKKGIVIPLKRKLEGRGTFFKEIKNLILKEGAFFEFEEIQRISQIKEVKKFIKTPSKFFGLFKFLEEELNYIEPFLKEGIDKYFLEDSFRNLAVSINVEGVFLQIRTKILWEKINLRMKRVFILPGFFFKEKELPSFIFEARTDLFNLKGTIQ